MPESQSVVADPQADADEAKTLYDITFTEIDQIRDMDAVILAVAHQEFSRFDLNRMDRFYGGGRKILMDIKGLLDRQTYETAGYIYWRL